jgi:hypothetical protein
MKGYFEKDEELKERAWQMVQAGLDERNMAKVVDRIVFVCAPKVLQAF